MLTLIFFAVLCVIPILVDAFSISDCEYGSLKDLYDETNGASWKWRGVGGIWNFTNSSSDPCLSSWQGVNCTNSGFNRTLRALNLEGYNLNGTLPRIFFECSQALEIVNFDLNILVGPIPISFGNLTQLQELDLDRNSLNGTIPESFGNLTQLKFLNLDRNLLTGTIPESIGNLTQLKKLDLDRNSLTGTIPESFGNLAQLQELDLDRNSLNGTIPESFGNLTQLKFLNLDRNLLTGTIPESLDKLTQLQELDLDRNLLTGTLPESLGKLTLLQELSFFINSLTGTIPESLCNLTQLKYFDLDRNSLNGTIPESLGSLTQLRVLDLDSNSLTGTIPASLGNLAQLKWLDLYKNFIEGTIPVSLGSLTHLQLLDLSKNSLTGTLPVSLGSLVNLLLLDLNSNALSGKIPLSLSNLTQLQRLFLHDNFFTGLIPENLFAKNTIDVSNNLLIGKIPYSVFERSKMETFVASKNCLSSEFPLSICNQTFLKSLILNGVGTNGRCKVSSYAEANVHFPSCIWSMRSLEQLYIAGNGLKGNLQIFELSNLIALNINSNSFTGTLSANISFNVFEVFDISRNQITGYLNTYVDTNHSKKKLEYYADSNRLSGAVNYRGIDEYSNVEVLSGNSISCDTLPRNDIAYTASVLFSDCETRPVYFSIIIWCFAFAVACSICAAYYNRVAKEISISMHLRPGAKIFQSLFPRALQLVVSLQKFHKLVLTTSLCMIISLVAIYSGFEFNENSNTDYKVLFEKYNYAISGIYLKSVSPAVMLFVVFTTLSTIFVYIIYRVFSIEWAVLSHVTLFSRSQEDSIPMKRKYIFIRYVLIVLFLTISLIMNVGYVYGLSGNVNVLALQITYLICNSLYQLYGTKLFLSYLNNRVNLTKIESATYHAVITTFSGIVNPCLATLIIDTNCFHDYVFGVSSIDASYSFNICSVFNVEMVACEQISEIDVQSSLTPPFIYGHQCRDAVFGNYIPVIFLSCAVDTFIYPFIHIYLTSRIQNLNSEIFLFSYFFDSRKLLLRDTLVYHLIEGIIFDVVLMILFGITYPLCFVFLVIDITSQTYLLIRSLHLYVELYQYTKKNDPQLVKENIEYLETMVGDAVLIAPYLIWPGLGAASIIFGLYLFDMAWDSKDNSIGEPIALLVLTLTSFTVIRIAFFRAKTKLETDLMHRVGSAKDDATATTSSVAENLTIARPSLDGLELVIMNPILT